MMTAMCVIFVIIVENAYFIDLNSQKLIHVHAHSQPKKIHKKNTIGASFLCSTIIMHDSNYFVTAIFDTAQLCIYLDLKNKQYASVCISFVDFSSNQILFGHIDSGFFALFISVFFEYIFYDCDLNLTAFEYR